MILMKIEQNLPFVELAPDLKISSGSERTCYEYPGDSMKCIKVKNPDCVVSRQQEREERYFRNLKNRKISWTHLPEFYGAVETNFGRGLVFSLVRDYDGRISKNLEQTITREKPGYIKNEIEDLKVYFRRWSIITCDMNLTNFLQQKLDAANRRLVMIDGLGNREFIRISETCSWMTRVKMRRRWRRFDNKLVNQYAL